MLYKLIGVFGSKAISSIANWLLIVICARYLGQESVVAFGMATAIVAPFIVFSNMSMRSVISTRQRITSYYLAELLLSKFFLFLFFLPFVIVWGYLDSENLDLSVLLIVYLIKIIDDVSEFSYGVAQRYGAMDKVSLSIYLHSISCIFSCLIGVIVGDLIYILLFMVGCKFAIYMLVDCGWSRTAYKKIYSRSLLGIRGGGSNVFSCISDYWSLGAALVLGVIFANIPRYFGGWILGQSDLAVIISASYFLMISNLFATSIGQVLSPSLRRMLKRRNLTLMKKASVAVYCCTQLVSIGVYFVPEGYFDWAMGLFYGGDFYAGGSILKVYIAASIQLFFQHILSYFRIALGAKISNFMIYLSGISVFVVAGSCVGWEGGSASIMLPWFTAVIFICGLSLRLLFLDFKKVVFVS